MDIDVIHGNVLKLMEFKSRIESLLGAGAALPSGSDAIPDLNYVLGVAKRVEPLLPEIERIVADVNDLREQVAQISAAVQDMSRAAAPAGTTAAPA